MRNMISMTIGVLAAILVSACASDPNVRADQTAKVARVTATVIAAATLSADDFGDRLAPVYTRNAMIRARATRALDAGRITVAQAEHVLRHTDRARQMLDDARKTRGVWRINVAADEQRKAEEAMQ
ncbi:MAG: hypothetical protein H7A16_10260 [Sinobacteraceae bacterium]|nr:hypothetical protein [Nevskiaceae bacterium]